MIRLSEAIAKANCVDEVTPEFVNEAFQLLRQSIISVEKDDIDIDDENIDQLQEDIIAAAEQDEEQDAIMGDDAPVPRQKTTITAEEYREMVNSLVSRVYTDHEQDEDGVEEEELVLWYTETREQDIESAEGIQAMADKTRKVLKRMDNILLRIRGEVREDESGTSPTQNERLLYIVHPNCDIEEMGIHDV
ncbi:hypothetical protein KCU75_g11552, partial [Aureobasidium melanogenum]